jgi:glycerol-3-phosphate cytidylyltransferase-like family protein
MSRKQLTKKEVVSLFRESHKNLPKGDAVMRSEARNSFTDALRTDKVISEKAYNTWTCP